MKHEPACPHCTFCITKVWARNFRSIAHTSMDLGDLTVLVGRNASGKSNALDMLRFVRDSVRFGLDTAVSRRHGMDRLRRYQRDQLVPAHEVELGLSVKVLEYSMDYNFVITDDFNIGPRVKREAFVVRTETGDVSDLSIVNGEPQSKALSLTPSSGFDPEDVDFLTNAYVLPALYSIMHCEKTDPQRKKKSHMQRALRAVHEQLRSLRFYHILPNLIREPQRPDSRYPLNEDGKNLPSFLRDLTNRYPANMDSIKRALGHLVQGIRDIRVEHIGGFLVVELGHSARQVDAPISWFDLSQESDGTLHLLGLLAALYQHPRHAFLGIEEPESTIHPGALPALAELLAEVSQTSQIVVTTHSPDLIDQLPIDCIRVVDLVSAATVIGTVSDNQVEAVKQHLFSPGDLHRTEGLHLGQVTEV